MHGSITAGVLMGQTDSQTHSDIVIWHIWS